MVHLAVTTWMPEKQKDITVMIHFSTQGTYLLLVSQGGPGGGDRVLISFLTNKRMFKTKL